MSSLDRILPFLEPIKDLLVDPAITEVMVNAGGRHIFVERNGCIEAVPARTLEDRKLTVAIKNIARACGDEISERQPVLDARGTGPGAGCSPSWQSPADGERRGSDGDCAPCRSAKSLPALELRRSSPGGVLCRPPALAWLAPQLKRQPWRERPRVLSRSAIASATRGGRSRHGCPARMDALRLAFLRVVTTAKPRPFLPPFCRAECREMSG